MSEKLYGPQITDGQPRKVVGKATLAHPSWRGQGERCCFCCAVLSIQDQVGILKSNFNISLWRRCLELVPSILGTQKHNHASHIMPFKQAVRKSALELELIAA
jgi:hypothetical protein